MTSSSDGDDCRLACSIFAGILSYKLYGWTLWMILHVLLGPWYVLYWLIYQSGIVR